MSSADTKYEEYNKKTKVKFWDSFCSNYEYTGANWKDNRCPHAIYHCSEYNVWYFECEIFNEKLYCKNKEDNLILHRTTECQKQYLTKEQQKVIENFDHEHTYEISETKYNYLKLKEKNSKLKEQIKILKGKLKKCDSTEYVDKKTKKIKFAIRVNIWGYQFMQDLIHLTTNQERQNYMIIVG